MTSLRLLDILVNIFVLVRSGILMNKIHRQNENGLSHALLMLFGSICAASIWAIGVMLLVHKVRLGVVMTHLFCITLQTYSIEQVDEKLFNGQ